MRRCVILFAFVTLFPSMLDAQTRHRDFGTWRVGDALFLVSVTKTERDSAYVTIFAGGGTATRRVGCDVYAGYLRTFLGFAERLRARQDTSAPGETLTLPSEMLVCGSRQVAASHPMSSSVGASITFAREIGRAQEWTVAALAGDGIFRVAGIGSGAQVTALLKAMNEASWFAVQVK